MPYLWRNKRKINQQIQNFLHFWTWTILPCLMVSNTSIHSALIVDIRKIHSLFWIFLDILLKISVHTCNCYVCVCLLCLNGISEILYCRPSKNYIFAHFECLILLPLMKCQVWTSGIVYVEGNGVLWLRDIQ